MNTINDAMISPRAPSVFGLSAAGAGGRLGRVCLVVVVCVCVGGGGGGGGAALECVCARCVLKPELRTGV